MGLRRVAQGVTGLNIGLMVGCLSFRWGWRDLAVVQNSALERAGILMWAGWTFFAWGTLLIALLLARHVQWRGGLWLNAAALGVWLLTLCGSARHI